MPETSVIVQENTALRTQLTPENLQFWDQLEPLLRQDPRLQDEETLQEYLNTQLTALVAAQKQGQTAAAYYHGDPIAAAQRLMKGPKRRPWWWTHDLWFPLGLFVVGLVLPTIILPAVPLQLLAVGVQLVLLVVALALGIWLTPNLGPRGRAIGWGVIVVALLVSLNLVGRSLPAVGLVYITRKGGSIFLLLFAVVLTGLILWDQRRHPDSWLPALIAALWIMTVLGLLARMAPTAGLMATSTGTLMIGAGTLVGDVSILVSGWHIWRQRQALRMTHHSDD